MSSGSTIILKCNENIQFVNNPSITYFKSVYRKYTKFAIIYNEFKATETFDNDNNQITIPMKYEADLLCNISLNVDLDISPSINASFKSDFPILSLDRIKFNLQGAGFTVEELRSEYVNFISMLNNPVSVNNQYNFDDSNKIKCNTGNNFQNMALCGGVKSNPSNEDLSKMSCTIPLPFAFSSSIGNSFPLCCLKMSNIEPQLILTKKEDFKIIESDDVNNDNIYSNLKYSVNCKYIILSDTEKLRFRNSRQEYLYEKVILLNDSNLTNILYSSNIIPIHNSLSNHPIKKIYIYNNKEDLNNLKFQLFINQQYTSSDALDHQYLSKIPFLNKYKGSIYKDGLINNNISLIDFSLKNTEGPSGSVNTSTNQLNLHITKGGTQDDKNWDINMYIVYYYLLYIEDQNIKYLFE